MKRVTFTYTCDFPDDLTDSECLESFYEIMGQDNDWSDDEFKIETIE
jgi:hypothetical protein